LEIYKNDRFIPNQIISASQKNIHKPCEYHGHNFFELEFILDGTGTCEVDGEKYSLERNTLFFLSTGSVHAVETSNATLVNVMFACDYDDMTVNLFSLLQRSFCMKLDEDTSSFIQALLLEIIRCCEQTPVYAMTLLHCIFFRLREAQDASQDNTYTSYIKKAILFIHERFPTGITLFDTATHLGLTPAYLSDIFHRQTGETFKAYLDEVRFSYARKLLRYTALSIKEAYSRAGFRDYTNFSRRFREKYGMTPTAYRHSYRDRTAGIPATESVDGPGKLC